MAIPLVEEGVLLGVVTRESISKGLMMENLEDSLSASKVMADDFVVIDYNTTDVSAVDSLLKIDSNIFAKDTDASGKIKAIYPINKLDILKLFRATYNKLS